MTREEIATMIGGIGVPFAYYQFPDNTGQNPPFICFYFSESDDLYADDSNYQKIDRLIVELYTSNKDFDLEDAVETTLNYNGLTWTRSEQYLDSEKLWMEVYETNVIITEGEINARE